MRHAPTFEAQAIRGTDLPFGAGWPQNRNIRQFGLNPACSNVRSRPVHIDFGP